MMQLKRIITFTKRLRKKLEIKKNKNQIGKHNTINLDWMMKLKTNKTFTKKSKKKIRNKKNKDQIRKYNIW
jgi:hypothetical protein